MKLALRFAVLAQAVDLGASQFAEPPPTTADPSTIQDCTWRFVAGATDTCDQLIATYAVTMAQLVGYVRYSSLRARHKNPLACQS